VKRIRAVWGLRLSFVCNDFKKLKVWKEAFQLVKQIYKNTSQFPDFEKYSLKSQINRASVSIVSNIAEGAVKNSKKDFKRFLFISLGSIAELETQLLIAKDLGYNIDELLFVKLKKIENMVIGLIKSLY